MRGVAGSPRRLSGPVAAVALVLGSAPLVVGAPEVDPVDLWQKSLAAQRFPDLQADATLTTTFPSGDTVTLHVKLLAVVPAGGTGRMAITRVTSGGPLLGSTFLNIERSQGTDDLWVYLPAVATPRRLVSSNLADSYLGSEFRYGDLVQPDPADYAVTLRGEETVEGEPCWVLEVVPREPRLVRNTGLGREVLWLRRQNLVERKVEQYDRHVALLKVLDVPRLFTDPASGKVFAVERRIRNVQSGVVSTASFENVEVNRGLGTEPFSPARLSDRSW